VHPTVDGQFLKYHQKKPSHNRTTRERPIQQENGLTSSSSQWAIQAADCFDIADAKQQKILCLLCLLFWDVGEYRIQNHSYTATATTTKQETGIGNMDCLAYSRERDVELLTLLL
jgi:hypothetical protein